MKRICTALSSSLCAALLCVPALAHVTLQSKEATPGASYRGVLAVPHGCAGSPTTRITVRIPEGMIAVKPMPKPGWNVSVSKGKYERTHDFMHGIKLSEGVREITWSGRLEDDFYDEFVFAGFLAGSVPQTVLYLPVVQECEKGVENWAEIPTAGQDAHALKSPAPALRVAARPAASPVTFRAGSIAVDTPWLRETPPGAQVAGGYMTITNTGTTPDRLTAATLEGAGRVEVHEMSMVDNVMRMRPLPGGLEIRPGATVALQPSGLHIMAQDLRRKFSAGEKVKGTLSFEKAGDVAIEYAVRPIRGGGEHQH